MAYVYKITRSDELEYIGITINFKKRIGVHKRSKRFQIGIKKAVILFEGTYNECEQKEPLFIEEYNTWKSGLNATKSGKGKNEDCIFNTFGFVYSEKSREKMRQSAKEAFLSGRKVPWNKGKSGYSTHTKETLKSISEKTTGSKNGNAVLNEGKVKDILEYYYHKPKIENVGKVQKNGVPMSYIQAFSKEQSKKYNVTAQAIKHIITGKSWKNVPRKQEI